MKELKFYIEKYKYISDWLLNLDLFLVEKLPFVYMDVPLSVFNMSGVSSSSSPTGNLALEEKTKYLMKHYPISYLKFNGFTPRRFIRTIMNVLKLKD